MGEEFDFLTWFEYAPDHAQAFEDMVARLRDTPEWGYIDREVDIRLRRDAAGVDGNQSNARSFWSATRSKMIRLSCSRN